MKKLLVKSGVVILLGAGIANYMIYLNTGRMPAREFYDSADGDWRAKLSQWWSPEDLLQEAELKLKSATDKYTEREQPASVKVYKWTDAQGRVHFGDRPSTGAEQLEVNIGDTISAPEQTASPSRVHRPESSPGLVDESPLAKARAAAEAMRQHNSAQDSSY
jgi:hypothetical protein